MQIKILDTKKAFICLKMFEFLKKTIKTYSTYTQSSQEDIQSQQAMPQQQQQVMPQQHQQAIMMPPQQQQAMPQQQPMMMMMPPQQQPMMMMPPQQQQQAMMMQPVMVMMMMPNQSAGNIQQPMQPQPIIKKIDMDLGDAPNINESIVDEMDDEPELQETEIKGLKHRLEKTKEKQAKLGKKVNNDIQLANMLDNTFDNVVADFGKPNDEKKETNAEFGQNSNNSNVIKEIVPKYKIYANFDKEQYPDEVYKITMLNGKEEEYKACDIHSYSLETHKYIYQHNEKNKLIYPTGFIYARCSTTNDISIETQRQACFNYAKTKNIRLLPFGYQYDNNVSARNMNNLEYELGFWEKYIPENSNVIIYSVDRLSRHLLKGIQFLDKLLERGIQIHFVSNELIYKTNMSSATKSMVQQELQTAEKYSNMTSEKIKGTFKRLREEGHVFGRAPYGYKNINIDGIRKRVRNDSEYDNINKIIQRYRNYIENFEMYPENVGVKRTYNNIMDALMRWCNRNGLKYRNGQSYTRAQLNKIVDMKINN